MGRPRQRSRRPGLESKMIKGCGNTEAAVDPRIVFCGYIGNSVRFQKGNKLTAADIEKHMPQVAIFFDRYRVGAALVAGPCSMHFPRGCGVEQVICLIDVTVRLLHLTSPARVVRPANQDVGIVYLRASQPVSVSGSDAL
jgi:hypothetical protein